MQIEKWIPPDLSPLKFATPEQIEAVVKTYVEEMKARGHIVGLANVQHLEMVAGINDVWRVSFASVMGEPPAVAAPDGMVSMPAAALVELVARAQSVVHHYHTRHCDVTDGVCSDELETAVEALRAVLP